jgi:hypothetical protein
MQQYIALEMNIPMSTVHGVVSFYSFFVTSPRGRHTIKFCMGTACYVGGVPQLIEKAKQILQVEPGETTPDGEFTLELCRCVGACSQAPVIVIDEEPTVGYDPISSRRSSARFRPRKKRKPLERTCPSPFGYCRKQRFSERQQYSYPGDRGHLQ